MSDKDPTRAPTRFATPAATSPAAAVTMVRDDLFFLEIWLHHYGRALGRENCHVIAHGRDPRVMEMAQGCNVIGIPEGDPAAFDIQRWKLLNNLVAGLRNYHRHVIVGDVDELVVVDPEAGMGLADYLAGAPAGRVYTPLGLELLHRPDLEPDPVAPGRILGPRRHVRVALHYAKPCVLSTATKIARGGHYTQYRKLFAPAPLYLFHLKFADLAAYAEAMDRRNAATDALGGADPAGVAIGRHWFAAERGDDRALFEGFARMPMAEGFDMAPVRRMMKQTWGPRGETGYWQFAQPALAMLYRLPDRFTGLF